MNYKESLAKISKELMLKEPYYGVFLLMLNKVWTESVKTAGVRLRGINFELLINPKFWEGLTDLQRLGLVKHEALHIIFNHVTDFGHLTEHEMANLAMDCEVNCYIDPKWLPDDPCTYQSFPQLDLKPKEGTNEYYKKLMTLPPQMRQAIKAAMRGGALKITIDGKEYHITNHKDWEQIPGGEIIKDLVKKQVEKLMKDAADSTTKSRGTVPGEIQQILDKLATTEPPKFDWRGYLRRFAGGSVLVYTKKLRRKPNRRFEEDPGLKILKKRHVLVAVDTSGSVSDGELQEFFHEIHHIHKLGSEVTVIQCDTAISSKEKYNPRQKIVVTGRGGTSFEPVIDYYNKNLRLYTCLIYLTDGEAPAPQKSLGRMLWVMSSQSKVNPSLQGPQIKLN